MFGENKNLKNPQKDSIKDTSSVSISYQAVGFGSMSYTKTNKLITALYMVTDIMDGDEPLRNKLRTLGIEIISDINFAPLNIHIKISEIMSFLDIASAINIVSEMNCSILKKEFLELDKSIKDFTGGVKNTNRGINLSEFLFESPLLDEEDVGGGDSSNITSLRPKSEHSSLIRKRDNSIGHYSNGHKYSTSIGVQKGSTLMKALSDRITPEARPLGFTQYAKNFDILKKQRRNDIISIIKTIGGNVTIKDIKDKIKTSQRKIDSLVSCGEKTLQRELVSMVKDSVLNKIGEKRWSRYFLKN